MVGKTSAPKSKTNKSSNQRPSSQQTVQDSVSAHHDVAQSPKQQQILLNIFSDTFAAVLSSDRFPALLREIKQALYQRDFAAAFGKEEYLETYAARWSPTRALCYASIFLGIHQYTERMTCGFGRDDENKASTTETRVSSGRSLASDLVDMHGEAPGLTPQSVTRMLCIGGCAAEHVAFASYVQATSRHGILTLLDAGPWANVVSLLQSAVTTAPPLSKYASALARASNKALLRGNQLDLAFTQADVLDLPESQLADVVGSQPQIVTLLFTLNEMYTEAGIGKTTKFLRVLGGILPAESLLLVVDSPGSYSEAAVGKEKKKYPMQWLLNHTLLHDETSSLYTWERLESHDSLWFRLPEQLVYPIQLESMRYQMHLYRLHRCSTE